MLVGAAEEEVPEEAGIAVTEDDAVVDADGPSEMDVEALEDEPRVWVEDGTPEVCEAALLDVVREGPLDAEVVETWVLETPEEDEALPLADSREDSEDLEDPEDVGTELGESTTEDLELLPALVMDATELDGMSDEARLLELLPLVI